MKLSKPIITVSPCLAAHASPPASTAALRMRMVHWSGLWLPFPRSQTVFPGCKHLIGHGKGLPYQT